LGRTEKANLNLCAQRFRIALCIGHISVGVPLFFYLKTGAEPVTETSFFNYCFKNGAVDGGKVQRLNDSKGNTRFAAGIDHTAGNRKHILTYFIRFLLSLVM
jgi:hypothetical protein